MDQKPSTSRNPKLVALVTATIVSCLLQLGLIAVGIIGHGLDLSLALSPNHINEKPTGTATTTTALYNITFDRGHNIVSLHLAPTSRDYPIVAALFDHKTLKPILKQTLLLPSQTSPESKARLLFPTSDEDGECPSFSNGRIPSGKHILVLAYNKVYIRAEGFAVSPTPCDPIFNRMRFRLRKTGDPVPPPVGGENIMEKYMRENLLFPLASGEVRSFELFQRISLFLYMNDDSLMKGCSIGSTIISVWLYGLCIAFMKKAKKPSVLCLSGMVLSVLFDVLFETGDALETDSAVFYLINLYFSFLPVILLCFIAFKYKHSSNRDNVTIHLDPIADTEEVKQETEAKETAPKVLPTCDSKRCSENEGPEFKFFCPICMLYYKSIYKTSCCSNQVCTECIMAFIKGKGLIEDDKSSLPASLPSAPCIHCMTDGFQLELLDPESEGRNYDDSPDKKAIFDKPLPSPLRVGDSFERMKKKMISFEATVSQNKAKTPTGTSSTTPSPHSVPVTPTTLDPNTTQTHDSSISPVDTSITDQITPSNRIQRIHTESPIPPENAESENTESNTQSKVTHTIANQNDHASRGSNADAPVTPPNI